MTGRVANPTLALFDKSGQGSLFIENNTFVGTDYKRAMFEFNDF